MPDKRYSTKDTSYQIQDTLRYSDTKILAHGDCRTRGPARQSNQRHFPSRGSIWFFDNSLHFLSLSFFTFSSPCCLHPFAFPTLLACDLPLSPECGMGSAARTLSAGSLPGTGNLQAAGGVEGPLLQWTVGPSHAQLRPHHRADQLLGGQRPLDPHQGLQRLPLLRTLRRDGRSAAQHRAHGLHVSEG